MAELYATDTDGQQQIVWMQERADTCGPASIYMIESMVRQASIMGGEDRVRFLESLLPNGYQDGKGTQDYAALARVLQQVGLPAAALYIKDVPALMLQNQFPFIARIGWPNGGGHFVVPMKIARNSTLVCLDPWYGLVQTPVASLPAYSVTRDYRLAAGHQQVKIGGTLSGHMVFQIASPT